ncbi:hypothetical protein SISNIDRAFT_419384, partial [Sistotremastrum niveocremeum HHB9708]
QFGLNAGPRHARCFGMAKSFTRPQMWSADERHGFNQAFMATLALEWIMVRALFPLDMTQGIQETLNKLKMPPISTTDIPAGCGIEFILNEVRYKYPTAERPPPEGYFCNKYVR